MSYVNNLDTNILPCDHSEFFHSYLYYHQYLMDEQQETKSSKFLKQ